MRPYKDWLNEELAVAATARNLIVKSTSKSRNPVPKKIDYIKALKQADKAIRFRFLDLPPEYRTEVYRYLLTFVDSWTCYPQILATCKQIQQEATKVLYGNNLIEVNISLGTVKAHRHACGSFDPYGRGEVRDLSELKWPAFLRRALFVRCTLAPYWLTHNAYQQARHSATISQVLYSLCSFLKGEHQLRSMELDLQALTFTRPAQSVLPRVYHSLHLLGTLKRLEVQTSSKVNDVSLVHSAITNTAHADNVLHDALALLEETDVYEAAVQMVRPSEPMPRPRVEPLYYPGLAVSKWPAFRKATTQAKNLMRPDLHFDEHWERAMQQATEPLRILLDEVDEEELEDCAKMWAKAKQITDHMTRLRKLRATRKGYGGS
ncbi:hypothetical protein LTR37_012352 [Vermiconidia calcicola]|uniref:Uncharacterized protein n=1 Tax=Vermiconidia calcicola TaxID=1690605 RepID=A0ACC3MZE2_9PEZI|nr:hypothetical protein LTR37_012352 [Vermiconidia calcicola]